MFIFFFPPPFVVCDSAIWFLSGLCVQRCMKRAYVEVLSALCAFCALKHYISTFREKHVAAILVFLFCCHELNN